MISIFLSLFIILYIAFDVNYLLRTYFTVVSDRVFERKYSLQDDSTTYGIGTFLDCDIWFRNIRVARLVRELDFARYLFYDRTGVYHRSRQLKIRSLQGCTFMMCEAPIPLFASYKIITKVTYAAAGYAQYVHVLDNFLPKLTSSGITQFSDSNINNFKYLLRLTGFSHILLSIVALASNTVQATANSMYCLIATFVSLLYIFWDVNYFLRVAFTIGIGRLFQKKCGVRDSTSIYGFCTTQDVDIFLRHMNNARYVRELDFARFHFYDRTGIYTNIKAVDGHALQGASSIRYRRTIPIFSAYKVETKLVYWEDTTLFIEQKFITLSDGFVRAVVLSRQNLINVNVEVLFKGIPGADQKPECPEEIKHWLQSIEISSAKLRKKD